MARCRSKPVACVAMSSQDEFQQLLQVICTRKIIRRPLDDFFFVKFEARDELARVVPWPSSNGYSKYQAPLRSCYTLR